MLIGLSAWALMLTVAPDSVKYRAAILGTRRIGVAIVLKACFYLINKMENFNEDRGFIEIHWSFVVFRCYSCRDEDVDLLQILVLLLNLLVLELSLVRRYKKMQSKDTNSFSILICIVLHFDKLKKIIHYYV